MRRRVIVRPSAGSVARFAVAIALTAVIVWRSDPRAVLASVARADLSWIGAALALVLVDRALMAYRWIVLLKGVDEGPPAGAVVRLFFVSTFVGTFLPASVGGDLVRAYGLSRTQVGAGAALASVLMDRLLGVLSLLLVALAGVGVARELLDDTAVVIALAVTAAGCGLGMAMIYSGAAAKWAASAMARVPIGRVGRVGGDLMTAVRAYSRHHAAVAVVLVSSVAVQGLRITQAYALGRALGLDVPFVLYLAFLPMILLIMLLPISIYGLGTSQLAFAALFGRVGVAAGDAVALSLLFLGLGIAGNLPGAFIYATGAGRGRQQAAR